MSLEDKLAYYVDNNVIIFIFVGFITYALDWLWVSGFVFGGAVGYMFMLSVAKVLRKQIDELKKEVKTR